MSCSFPSCYIKTVRYLLHLLKVKQTPARLALYRDQLITTAERKLVKKPHLPSGYLKERKQLVTLEKTSAIGESGWGYSSLKCFSLSSVPRHSLPRFPLCCMGGTHISIPFIPRGETNPCIITQIKLNLFHML